LVPVLTFPPLLFLIPAAQPGQSFLAPILLTRLEPFGAGKIRGRLNGGRCGFCGVEGCAGCRALARAITGNILADDPQCLLCE
jgi:hypothetical protein